MSTLRRLAFAGAFALPISLCIAAPSSASTLDGPFEPWSYGSSESSATWAGIGGAGTTDTEEGYDYWGHHWSEEDTAVAGIGGAAVTHSEQSDADDDWDDDGWTDTDTDYDHGWNGTHHVHGWTGDHDGDHMAVNHHHAVSHPDPVEPADHVTYTQPVADIDDDDDDDAGYAHESHSAGPDGATSTHVASYAGDDHAAYASSHLAAGPDGASSEGVHAVAVPGYAGYHNWYTAAGPGGTAVYSTTAVADAHDHDWSDGDNDYDSYDED
jgi:hypothetical protein